VTILTHVVVTTLGVRVLGLHGSDAALAYAFGVGPDIDHVVKLPYYVRAVGLRNQKDYYWRSSLQEPVAVLWITPLCILLGTLVPLIFFLAHVALDYSVRYEKMPWYPYSTWVTRGWLTAVPDKVKEIAVLVPALVLTLWLFVARR
jgi:hypothetical protein